MSLRSFGIFKFSFPFRKQMGNNNSFCILRQTLIWLFLFFFLIQPEINSQSFPISSHTAQLFTIDRFTNDVYYKHYPNIYKTELKTLTTTVAEFPTLPVFANKSHLAAYRINDTIFVKDFNLDTTYAVLTTEQTNPYFPPFSFSPNDSNLITGTKYYSFKDSSVYSLSFEMLEWDPDLYEWSSDSTIIISFGHTINILEQFHLYSDIVDTIITLGEFDAIMGFAYNMDFNILAYSKLENIPTINFYYLDTQIDSIIFDPSIHDTTTLGCWGSPIALTSLVWSRNNRRLAFFNMLGTNPGSGLYTFHIDSNRTYKHLNCDDFGLKYYMRWVANDTVVFSSLDYIFGYDTKLTTTGVRSVNNKETPHTIHISNYPNPFNPTTIIRFTIPYVETGHAPSVQLKIYDVLGNEVATLVNEEKPPGIYEVEFDGSSLPSGIYFYQLRTGNLVGTKKMVLLR